MNEGSKKEIERLRVSAANAPTLMHSIGYYNHIYDIIILNMETELLKARDNTKK